MFPQQLEDMYTKPRSAYELKKPANPMNKGKGEFTVNIDGAVHNVTIEEIA